MHRQGCLTLYGRFSQMTPRSYPTIGSIQSPQDTFATVADRIAHFESLCHNPVLVPFGSVMSKPDLPQHCIRRKKKNKERHSNQVFVHFFLQAIGQGTTVAMTTGKIQSIALVWWEIVQCNLKKQMEENGSMGCSSLASFDLMTASLDPKCAMLEVEGMEELSHC